MANNDIPQEYYGWWQIIDTSQWAEEFIDILGAALISFTGYNDRLRMFALLAHVNCKPTKTGVSFTWRGAWEYDPVSGTGSVKAAPGVVTLLGSLLGSGHGKYLIFRRILLNFPSKMGLYCLF